MCHPAGARSEQGKVFFAYLDQTGWNQANRPLGGADSRPIGFGKYEYLTYETSYWDVMAGPNRGYLGRAMVANKAGEIRERGRECYRYSM